MPKNHALKYLEPVFVPFPSNFNRHWHVQNFPLRELCRAANGSRIFVYIDCQAIVRLS